MGAGLVAMFHRKQQQRLLSGRAKLTARTDSVGGKGSYQPGRQDTPQRELCGFSRGFGCGFSLIELTIVLVVVALLAGSGLLVLTSQVEVQHRRQVNQDMQTMLQVIKGFVVVHGRLPCPAAPDLAHEAAQSGEEDCSRQHGVLPWRTLSIAAEDPWGNRWTYFASRRFTVMPSADGVAGFTLDTGAGDDTTGMADIYDSGDKNSKVALDVAAVLLSHGKNGAMAYGANGRRREASVLAAENENGDADLDFVAHEPDARFDDLLQWISTHQVKSWLVEVGKLP